LIPVDTQLNLALPGTIRDMKIRKLERRKRAEWLVDYYEGPRRIRKWYESKALAEAALADNPRLA
jgi:hypothetical protein